MPGLRYKFYLFIGMSIFIVNSAIKRPLWAAFDIQPAPVTAAPRDLILAQQSQPTESLMPNIGLNFRFSLNPFGLYDKNENQIIGIVKNRINLDFFFSFSLFKTLEIGVVFPIIAFQQSDDLQPLGVNGTIKSSALGDPSIYLKVPLLRRAPAASGFGVAIATRINLPLGNPEAFTGDGTVSVNPSFIVDYRFSNGALIVLQPGIFFRKTENFYGVPLGHSFTLSAAAEFPIVRKFGITIIGGVYTNVPLLQIEGYRRQIPAEALLGVRWYSSFGVTFTIGSRFGCDCGFGVPTFALFTHIAWSLKDTKEQQAIEIYKANDQCPEVPQEQKTTGECPVVYVTKDKKIILLKNIQFATDSAIISPDTENIQLLDKIAGLILNNSLLSATKIEVAGYASKLGRAEYNLLLSKNRANAVMQALIAKGIPSYRLIANGYGYERPVAGNETDEGRYLNQRVEFKIIAENVTAPSIETSGPTKSATGVLTEVSKSEKQTEKPPKPFAKKRKPKGKGK